MDKLPEVLSDVQANSRPRNSLKGKTKKCLNREHFSDDAYGGELVPPKTSISPFIDKQHGKCCASTPDEIILPALSWAV